MIRRLARSLPAVALLLALAAVAHACPVCGAEGAARNRAAFFGTTVLLSLLPLAMIGGGVWWVVRRLPHGLARELEVTDSSAGPLPGESPRAS